MADLLFADGTIPQYRNKHTIRLDPKLILDGYIWDVENPPDSQGFVVNNIQDLSFTRISFGMEVVATTAPASPGEHHLILNYAFWSYGDVQSFEQFPSAETFSLTLPTVQDEPRKLIFSTPVDVRGKYLYTWFNTVSPPSDGIFSVNLHINGMN